MIKQLNLMNGLKSFSALLGVLLALGFSVSPAIADKMEVDTSETETEVMDKEDDEMSEPVEDKEVDMDDDEMSNDKDADKAEMNLVETAVAAEGFDTLVAAVKAAGLVETLSGEEKFTVFAPTDEAFAALGEDTLKDLLKPENKDKLVAILTYHVVPGVVKSTDLEEGKVKTVEGSKIKVQLGDSVMVNDATVVKADIITSNGVIHVIDKVILPKK